MITKLPFLFDLTKLDKRKTPDQKEFEKANLPFLLRFREIAYKSLEMVQKNIFSLFEPSDMDRNLSAVAMISFIRKAIIKEFPAYCRRASRKRFKLLTPNNEWIFIKKLYDDLRPSNIETAANNLILNQLTIDKKDKGSNIFLGYTCTPDYSAITGVYAVCIDGDTIVWRTDLNILHYNQLAVLKTMKTNKTDVKLKEGTVKIKKAKRE